MMENLDEITKRVGDQMTAVGWELNSEFTQIGSKLQERDSPLFRPEQVGKYRRS